MADTGADIIEFDDVTDFDLARRVSDNKVCLLGNVNTTEIAFGQAEDVVELCRSRLEQVLPASGYILSSGCAISPNAPAANLQAMVDSARKFGRYPEA